MCRAHETHCVPAASAAPRPRLASTPRQRAKAAPAWARSPGGPNLGAASESSTHGASGETPAAHSGGFVPHFSAHAPSSNAHFVTAARPQPAPLDEAEDDSPHIIGPAVADDRHFLEDYLSTTQAGHGAKEIRPVFPGISSLPVVFTRVKRRPLGISRDMSLSKAKLQMIEKLLEPHQQHVVDMYASARNRAPPTGPD